MILYGEGASNDYGSDGGEREVVLKKGPWTAAEDETLAAYVREYGEGNWNSVQKKTWLARCGKSCRLRWANHLRPNLRKGSFTADEERLIIQLHSQLGNKWARMAAQLPGRTDNEIKNFWNTRLKRFQRQGLPLYPPDITPNTTQQLPKPNTPSSPTHAFHTSNIPLFQQPSLPPKRCYDTAFSSLSTKPSYTSQTFLQTHSSYHQPTNPVYSMKPELPSNKIPYSASLGLYHVSKSSDNGYSNQNLNSGLHISTCQLLEDLMDEAEALADSYRAPKRRQLMTAPEDNDNNNNNFVSGLQPEEGESLQMSTMQDEDIAKLLDWRSQSEEISNGQSFVVTTEENLVLDNHLFALLFPVDEDDNNNTSKNPSVSCSWDNLPGLC